MEVDCDEFGINSGDYLDYLASGRGAKMALQQKLGLWTKRRPRSNSADHSDSPPAGENLDKRPLSPLRTHLVTAINLTVAVVV